MDASFKTLLKSRKTKQDPFAVQQLVGYATSSFGPEQTTTATGNQPQDKEQDGGDKELHLVEDASANVSTRVEVLRCMRTALLRETEDALKRCEPAAPPQKHNKKSSIKDAKKKQRRGDNSQAQLAGQVTAENSSTFFNDAVCEKMEQALREEWSFTIEDVEGILGSFTTTRADKKTRPLDISAAAATQDLERVLEDLMLGTADTNSITVTSTATNDAGTGTETSPSAAATAALGVPLVTGDEEQQGSLTYTLAQHLQALEVAGVWPLPGALLMQEELQLLGGDDALQLGNIVVGQEEEWLPAGDGLMPSSYYGEEQAVQMEVEVEVEAGLEVGEERQQEVLQWPDDIAVRWEDWNGEEEEEEQGEEMGEGEGVVPAAGETRGGAPSLTASAAAALVQQTRPTTGPPPQVRLPSRRRVTFAVEDTVMGGDEDQGTAADGTAAAANGGAATAAGAAIREESSALGVQPSERQNQSMATTTRPVAVALRVPVFASRRRVLTSLEPSEASPEEEMDQQQQQSDDPIEEGEGEGEEQQRNSAVPSVPPPRVIMFQQRQVRPVALPLSTTPQQQQPQSQQLEGEEQEQPQQTQQAQHGEDGGEEPLQVVEEQQVTRISLPVLPFSTVPTPVPAAVPEFSAAVPAMRLDWSQVHLDPVLLRPSILLKGWVGSKRRWRPEQSIDALLLPQGPKARNTHPPKLHQLSSMPPLKVTEEIFDKGLLFSQRQDTARKGAGGAEGPCPSSSWETEETLELWMRQAEKYTHSRCQNHSENVVEQLQSVPEVSEVMEIGEQQQLPVENKDAQVWWLSDSDGEDFPASVGGGVEQQQGGAYREGGAGIIDSIEHDVEFAFDDEEEEEEEEVVVEVMVEAEVAVCDGSGSHGDQQLEITYQQESDQEDAPQPGMQPPFLQSNLVAVPGAENAEPAPPGEQVDDFCDAAIEDDCDCNAWDWGNGNDANRQINECEGIEIAMETDDDDEEEEKIDAMCSPGGGGGVRGSRPRAGRSEALWMLEEGVILMEESEEEEVEIDNTNADGAAGDETLYGREEEDQEGCLEVDFAFDDSWQEEEEEREIEVEVERNGGRRLMRKRQQEAADVQCAQEILQEWKAAQRRSTLGSAVIGPAIAAALAAMQHDSPTGSTTLRALWQQCSKELITSTAAAAASSLEKGRSGDVHNRGRVNAQVSIPKASMGECMASLLAVVHRANSQVESNSVNVSEGPTSSSTSRDVRAGVVLKNMPGTCDVMVAWKAVEEVY